jgi:hypothetical protein
MSPLLMLMSVVPADAAAAGIAGAAVAAAGADEAAPAWVPGAVTCDAVLDVLAGDPAQADSVTARAAATPAAKGIRVTSQDARGVGGSRARIPCEQRESEKTRACGQAACP